MCYIRTMFLDIRYGTKQPETDQFSRYNKQNNTSMHIASLVSNCYKIYSQ